MDKLNDLKEASQRLRLAESTVRVLIAQGKVQAVRLGRRIVVEESALEAFIASRRTEVAR